MKTRKVDGMPFGLKKPNREAAMTTNTRWTQPMPPLLGALACPAMTPVCADLERRGYGWKNTQRRRARTSLERRRLILKETSTGQKVGARAWVAIGLTRGIEPMNVVLTNLSASERPETPCTSCRRGIWHVRSAHAPKLALAAFCGLLGQQVYSSHDNSKTVQTCAAYEPDGE